MSSTDSNGFLLPPGTGASCLVRQLESEVKLHLDGTGNAKTVYLDSFDWRLFAAGKVLELSDYDDTCRLRLRSRAGIGDGLAGSGSRIPPRWPGDVEPGPLRDELGKLLDMRALLPLAQVDTRVHRYRVLNEDDKTVAWLTLEQPQCHLPGRREQRTLLPRIRLRAVRGYQAETDAVAAQLINALELPEAPALLYDEAMTAVGRHPGDYSSKIRVALTPDLPAGEAVRRIFLHLLQTLEANVDGTRQDIDSEFLHDLRVATRRTRSALTQIKGVLPPAVLADFKQRFAWLGRVTGPTRDLDVFLLTFPEYQSQLPPAQRADLEPLRDFLAAHQQSEQAALRRKLSSPHFRKLLNEWHALLEAPWDQAAPAQPNAARPIKDVADERIWRMFRRVLREGRAIEADSPAADLHELRKSCKKLRYLIEFFQSLYGDDVGPLVSAVKRLLDNLGEFQDLEVQADKLTHFGAQMQQESDVPLPTLLAIGGLVSDLLRRQVAARDRFQGRFEAFDSKRNRRAYRKLFKPRDGA